MPAHRPGRLARPAPPDPAPAALELLLRVLADLDAGDGVLIWLLDATAAWRACSPGRRRGRSTTPSPTC
jgi:hypothetical protein